jgi:hypothetical protein
VKREGVTETPCVGLLSHCCSRSLRRLGHDNGHAKCPGPAGTLGMPLPRAACSGVHGAGRDAHARASSRDRTYRPRLGIRPGPILAQSAQQYEIPSSADGVGRGRKGPWWWRGLVSSVFHIAGDGAGSMFCGRRMGQRACKRGRCERAPAKFTTASPVPCAAPGSPAP